MAVSEKPAIAKELSQVFHLVAAFNTDFIENGKQIGDGGGFFFRACFFKDDIALVEHQHPIAVFHRIAEVVCDHDGGQFLLFDNAVS